ncbi:MAG TPA: hypothetical protein VFH51_06975, partial [Myxococcota bacterium]|nr:hypothetical protein [Myxococcota bacterium]
RPAPQPVSARQPHGDLDVTAVIARLAQGVHQQVAIAVRHHAESGAHARAPLHDRQELNFFRARLQEVQQHHAAIVQRCASRGQVAQGARGPARAVPGIIAGPHGTQWAPRGQGLDVHTPAGVRHIALTTEPESVMFNRRRTMAYAKHRHANLATIIDLRSLRVVGLADIARSE